VAFVQNLMDKFPCKISLVQNLMATFRAKGYGR